MKTAIFAALAALVAADEVFEVTDAEEQAPAELKQVGDGFLSQQLAEEDG